MVLLLLLASKLAAASAWQPHRFHDGERYEYEFVWEHPDGTVDTGEFIIAVQRVRSDLQVSVALLAAGEHYEVTTRNHAADYDYVYIIDDLHEKVRNSVSWDLALPFLLTLWEPWHYTPLDGMVLQEGMPLLRELDGELTIEVVGRMDVAGRSGLRLDVVFGSEGVDLEHFDMVVDPQLALPLSVSLTHLSDGLVVFDSLLTVQLVSYQADAALREPRHAADPLGLEAADAGWWPFAFQDGEGYVYEFTVEYPEGAVKTGAFVIAAQDMDDRERLMRVELTMQEERYETMSITHATDVPAMFRDIYVEISNAVPTDLASVFFMTLWVPWFDSSLDGMVLDDVMPFFYDEEYGYTLDFGERIELAGRSGYLMDVRFADDGVPLARLDMAVDPQLALPIYVAVPEMPENTAVPGAQVVVRLTEYRSDCTAP